MSSRFLTVTILFCLSLAWVAFDAPLVQAAPSEADVQLWAEANARIEKYRKADVTITVTDSAGAPVVGAEVDVEQTKHAFLFGCNIFGWGRAKDESGEEQYRQRFADVFNFATLAFYWPSYENRQGQPNHKWTEKVATWCRQEGITCKGHPLAWNYSEPRWLPDDGPQILDLQLKRIDDCVVRFSDSIDIWDVVNEATHFDRAEFVRKSPKFTAMWSDVGQVQFTRQCFQRARQANEDATLLINDYRVDAAYARLIEQLVDEDGKPLYNAIGIQSHQHGGTWTNRKIWEVCERFAKFDVPLHFTETTIVSGKRGWELAGGNRDGWPSTEEGEAEQACEVERFYTLVYSHPAVEALTWWDFSDRGAWQKAPAGFLHKDMSCKPAYDTLHRLIKEEWWTRTSGITSQQGTVQSRATLGDYRISVKLDGKTVADRTMTVSRDGSNQLEIRLPE